MNWWVISTICALLILLSRLRLPILVWLVIWPVAIWCLIRLGITPHVPQSVLSIYVYLTMIGMLAYLLADRARWETVVETFRSFITEKRYAPFLYFVMVLIPAGMSAKIYFEMNAEVRAPTFGRTIHPPPPGEISFKGKSINLASQKNPYRELEKTDQVKFQEHIQNGRRVYYENCVFCHGDNLGGDGIFAHGFEPVPANFNSETTIPMLQESYLFWRIAKGGPGLPEESGPWSSSMPAWEKFLSEDEIWDVILFLYEYVGVKPRAEEEHH